MFWIILFYIFIFLLLLLYEYKDCLGREGSNETPMEESRSNQSETMRDQNVRASMNHDRPGAGDEVSFDRRAKNVRRTIKVLPLLKTFKGNRSANCPICMEEFKEGELIQPFGFCAHEFHSSCLNSWLLGGKTTCPICRQKLLIVVDKRQRN
ncbi:unnamed protein product [Lathyrus oleraceus]